MSIGLISVACPPVVPGTVIWNNVALNGGGFHMGLSIADDGTLLVRTDIAGAFKRVGGSFTSLNGSHTVDYSMFLNKGYRALWGCAAAEVAPSNSSIIYMMVADKDYNNRQEGCYLFKSTNGGITFTNTSYPVNFALSNAAYNALTLGGANTGGGISYKRINKRVAIDPVNPNVVYVSNPCDAVTPTNKTLVTFNGGASFTDVPSLPAGTQATQCGCCFQFDRSSGTVVVSGQTVTRIIFCCVAGSGTWRSTDGGVSFTLISATAGKDDPQYSAISADGVFYISNAPGGAYSLDRYQSGTWTMGLLTDMSTIGYANSAGYLVSIAAHPTVAGVIVGLVTTNHSPHVLYSSNYGSSFPSATRISKAAETYQASDILWWQTQMMAFDMAGAGCLFDPANPNDLYACMGQGACKTTLTGSPPSFPGNAPTWTGITQGIENVVCDDLIHETGRPMLNVVADLVGFMRPTSTLDTAPSITTFGALATINGWSGAVDPVDTSKRVLVSGELSKSGYSTDAAGATWTPFATKPYLNIGSTVPGEVMMNNGVILWMSNVAASGADAMQAHWARTTVADGGATWRLLSETSTPGCILQSPGVTLDLPYGSGIFPGWGVGNFALPVHSGCADRVDPSTFYIYNQTFLPVNRTVIMTSANPGVVTTYDDTPPTHLAGHSLYVNAKVVFTTTGALPTNVTAGATYYVKTVPTGTTFTFSATRGGTAVDTTTGTQSGVHTCTFNPVKGMYKSVDAGLTFTYLGASSDPYVGTGTLVRSLKCVPGTSTLFAATGYQTANPVDAHPTAGCPFKKSVNGGLTWTTVTGMQEVNGFGFGKAGPSTNPTLFVVGWYNNLYGVYMSQDLGGTWLQLKSVVYGVWPGRNDAVQCVEGDKDVFGRCYIGFRGSGTVYSTLLAA